MKKRLTKILLATTLCIAMVGSTCFAAGGEIKNPSLGGSIEGESGVVNPIYRVVIPTALTYAIDAFEQQGQSQIYSGDFSIINKSNLPVKVDVKVKATPKTDVTLVASAAEVSETDTTKNLYFAAEFPSAVVETAAAAAEYETPDGVQLGGMVGDGTKYYKDAATETAVGASGGTSQKTMVDTTAVAGTYTKSAVTGLATTDTTLTFALAGAEYISYYDDATTLLPAFKQVAASEAGTTAFRFTGTVNSKAAWADADLKAAAVYNFIGLTPANYTALKAKEVAIDDSTKAHGYVKEDNAPTIANTVASVAVGSNATWSVDLGAGTLAAAGISKITFVKGSSTSNLGSTYYTFTNGTLTILPIISDTYTAFKVYFDDDAGTTMDITVTHP